MTRKQCFYWGSKLNGSGNINEETIRAYAECGVNYISSGALTFCVYMDLSLKAI
jgi:nicotinate-nucleotide pyrophosphorylase (carboxylating)